MPYAQMEEWLKSHRMSIDALTPFNILNYPYLDVIRKEKNKVIQNRHKDIGEIAQGLHKESLDHNILKGFQ